MNEKELKAYRKWGQHVVDRYLAAGWTLDEINQGYAIIRKPLHEELNLLSGDNVLQMNVIEQLDPLEENIKHYKHYYYNCNEIQIDKILYNKLRILYPYFRCSYPIKCLENDNLLKQLNNRIKVHQFTVQPNLRGIDDDLKSLYQFVETNRDIIMKQREGIIEEFTPQFETHDYIQGYINNIFCSAYSNARLILDCSCKLVETQYLYSQSKPSIEEMRKEIILSVNYVKKNVLSEMQKDLEAIVEEHELEEQQEEENDLERVL